MLCFCHLADNKIFKLQQTSHVCLHSVTLSHVSVFISSITKLIGKTNTQDLSSLRYEIPVIILRTTAEYIIVFIFTVAVDIAADDIDKIIIMFG